MLPDWIVYAAMGVMAIGTLATAVGMALVAIATAHALQAGLERARQRRRQAALREQLVQQLASGRLVTWLACHSLTCGHLETVHHPATDGELWVCEVCGTPAAAPAP